jgi:hypothetical protein
MTVFGQVKMVSVPEYPRSFTYHVLNCRINSVKCKISQEEVNVARRPDINDEEIGIRTFKLRKERAAEIGMERVRYGLGGKWANFSAKDLEILEWTLGECWALMGFADWNRITFSALKAEDVEKIINTAKDIIAHKKRGYSGFEEIIRILRS